jgi:CO/xanthine dehydrogenase Mo-binding subunit
VVAELNVVGRPLGRIEGEAKVTGQARYAADVRAVGGGLALLARHAVGPD